MSKFDSDEYDNPVSNESVMVNVSKTFPILYVPLIDDNDEFLKYFCVSQIVRGNKLKYIFMFSEHEPVAKFMFFHFTDFKWGGSIHQLVGDSITLFINGIIEEKEMEGCIILINPYVDEKTGLRTAEIAIDTRLPANHKGMN